MSDAKEGRFYKTEYPEFENVSAATDPSKIKIPMDDIRDGKLWTNKQLVDFILEQDETIKELTELVQLTGGGIEKYGNTKNWVQESDGNWYGVISHDDVSSVLCAEHETEWGEPFADKGGKRAREIQENELFKKYYKKEEQ